MTFFELVVAWLIGKALDRAAVKFGPTSPPSPPPRRPPPPKVPDRSRRPTVVPSSSTVPVATTTSAPAWPQVVPSGLPPFPGAGWVPDNPPPPAVVTRAHQLLPALWASGVGTFKVEKTAGRWIVYRASPTSGGGKGVVAFRESQHSAFLTPPTPTQQAGPVLVRAPSSSASPATVPASSSAAPSSSTVPASTSTSTSLPTLRRGSRGPEVAIAQRALGIADDGIFGPGTDAAVRAYQRSRGLTPDGVIGPQTWTSLLAGKAA